MKHLLNVNADSEATFRDYDMLYYVQDSDKSYIKKYYENPFIKIFMNDTYHDTSIIPLIARKYGIISGDIEWSHNLGNIAKIEDGVIRFMEHYTGKITVTATAGGKTASHTATIECVELPTSYEYSIMNVSSPTANWNDEQATINFTYRVIEHYPLNPSVTTDTPQSVTVTFPRNEHEFNYATSNKYVDLGLSTGLKWAACNIGTQNEYEHGLFFQWGDTEGFYTPKKDASVTRTGTFDFESVAGTPWTVTQQGFQKVFDWAHYKYCKGSSTTMTKYCTDSSYGTVGDKTTLEPTDDAAIQNLRSQSGHEEARMPTSTEYQTLYNETLWVLCPGGNVGIKKTDESGNESIEYIAYPSGYFVFKTESDKKQKGTFTKDENDNLIGYTATSGTVYYPGAHEVTKGDGTSIADGDTHIFFTNSGYANGTEVNGRGSRGNYWSSSLHPSLSYNGLHLFFNSGGIGPQLYSIRYNGFCVRSVLENLS